MEDIINPLVHLPSLKVISPTSSFAFKHIQKDIREIEKALGVNSILEGSIRIFIHVEYAGG